MSEFALIRSLLEGLPGLRPDVCLGPGDDAALLQPPAGSQLAVTTDTLIAGRHFPSNADAASIGWKSIIVNLSDLAAMAADPAWITMTLALPEADNNWLQGFMQGVGEALSAYGVSLVGGDLTRGPLAINVCAMGFLRPGQALRRDAARPGDLVCVTGTLGDAALGLALWESQPEPDDAAAVWLADRLHRPTARVAAGQILRGQAHAAADISDGLAADLGHILETSGVGAQLNVSDLPQSAAFAKKCPVAQRAQYQLAGGDDYELCVILPPSIIPALRDRVDCGLTPVGVIQEAPGLRLLLADGSPVWLDSGGFDHFRSP